MILYILFYYPTSGSRDRNFPRVSQNRKPRRVTLCNIQYILYTHYEYRIRGVPGAGGLALVEKLNGYLCDGGGWLCNSEIMSVGGVFYL
jgi:hypothetical protein